MPATAYGVFGETPVVKHGLTKREDSEKEKEKKKQLAAWLGTAAGLGAASGGVHYSGIGQGGRPLDIVPPKIQAKPGW